MSSIMEYVKSDWLVPDEVMETDPDHKWATWMRPRPEMKSTFQYSDLWICHGVTRQLFDLDGVKTLRILASASKPPKGENYAIIHKMDDSDYYLYPYEVNGSAQEFYPEFEKWVDDAMRTFDTNTLYIQLEVK